MNGTYIVSVALQNVTFHIDKLYDYKVPAELYPTLKVGCRVLVPFGKACNERKGIVISLTSEEDLKEVPSDTSSENLKYISDVLDKEPLFTPKMIALAVFMKERTFCTLYDALKIMLPGTGQSVSDATIRMVRPEISETEADEVAAELPKKQAAVLNELLHVGTCSVKELCYFTGVTVAVINALQRKGIVSFYEKEVFRRPYEGNVTDESEIQLIGGQKIAFENLMMQYSHGGGTSLLYGVTGSGKTQVYLKLIDEVVKTGRGVIVMVPEISLTPQTLDLFHARYGDKVAVFHSALSAGERYDEWKRVKKGLASIAVGTRSAVFAPFSELGLIIMDEEQEHTYKSEQSPRYHARDIAKYRAAEDKALLVLASATPSFESFTAAKLGKYTLNVLKDRYGDAELPEVEVVDMTAERRAGNHSEISRSLLTSLMDNLENGHQSILLLNRRGYNTFAACDSCGEVITCPNCSISLTYHRANDRLMCHYCGYSIPFTAACPKCGEQDVRYAGAGTQLFEEELSKYLPGARILRMDADTTMQKFAYDEKLTDFRNGKYDIMVGTQMVAKGLDFENVTLVGVLSSDRQLYNDDYRSMETTFDLLTQVVGRAGRGRFPGKAVIQTITPSHDVIRLASRQDFESFYETEIAMRKAMIYPPYCNICSVSFQGLKEEKVHKTAFDFLELLRIKTAAGGDFEGTKLIALGPMPERVYKVSGKYRYRLIVKCKNDKNFRALLSDMISEFGKRGGGSGVSIIPDIT